MIRGALPRVIIEAKVRAQEGLWSPAGSEVREGSDWPEGGGIGKLISAPLSLTYDQGCSSDTIIVGVVIT